MRLNRGKGEEEEGEAEDELGFAREVGFPLDEGLFLHSEQGRRAPTGVAGKEVVEAIALRDKTAPSGDTVEFSLEERALEARKETSLKPPEVPTFGDGIILKDIFKNQIKDTKKKHRGTDPSMFG